MAARENQGLQIALIVFVMLTIMLSVSTFLFFRNYQSEQQKAKTAQDTASAETQKANASAAERDTFMQYIGFPATEKKETVDEGFKKDFDNAVALGLANLPEDQRNYRKMMENYQALAKSLHGQIADKDKSLRDSKATFDQKMKEAAEQVTAVTNEKDAKVAEYAAERKNREDQIAALTKTKDDLIAKNDATTKAFDDLKAKSDSEINKLKEEIAKKDETIRDKNITLDGVRGTYDVNAAPDGRIIWVNQREGIAVINLGTADNLRKRITFSVFDPGTTDVSALKSDNNGKAESSTPASVAVTKGSIEVINITENHMAECRILQHSPSNPIIPGDVIYTPVWQPGQQDHFAFAGKIDIDGDGQDDLPRVKDIVQVNGGAIDTDVSVGTRYMVVGKLDEAEGSAGSKMLAEATKYGIQHIKLSQFLEMMGYSAKASEGVIKPGEGMNYPRAGETPAKFRPRNPPPRPSATSAFGERTSPNANK